MMNTTNNILEAQNDEFIHDLSFDFFGKRIATCSSDHWVRIYSKDDKGNWIKTASFQAHDAIIWKVKWAHPDYGSIMATCSADKTVIIWEEKKQATAKASTPLFKAEEEESVWQNRIRLPESKESIEDIKFAPKHIGLVVAAASADGSVRIYEAADLMRLNSWKAPYRIEVNSLGINCISWNKNPFDPPMIVIGSKDAATSFMNRSLMKVQYTSTNTVGIENGNVNASPDDKYLSIYLFKGDHWHFLSFLSFENSTGDKIEHTSAVNDVSWNQLNGRSYHLIASCGKDGVFVWYVKFIKEESGVSMKILDAKRIYSGVNIWKCSFNIMGTLLSFSGQDNKVRICKGGYDRSWSIVEEFEEEGLDSEENDSIYSQTEEKTFTKSKFA